MKMKDIYKYLDDIGVLTFSTIHEGEVHSRSAHFNGFDEEGFYFRTMTNKPFDKQLVNTEKLTVCGCSDPRVLSHGEDGIPFFPPSYTIRLIGSVRNVEPEEIMEKAKTNDYDISHEYKY